MAPEYLFGDSDTAARRLELLARVFAGSTREFVARAADRRYTYAVDLGCGPGFTTHLIANTLRCDHALGLDMSARFIELARQNANERVSFELHDVCTVPFPGAAPDLVFCRFLLTHLKDPANTLAKWASQLTPDGLLLVQETEAISTPHPVFSSYLEIVEAMLASHSNLLYAGPIVAAMESAGKFTRVRSRLVRLPIKNHLAARMFLMNMKAWKDGPFIRASYAGDAIRKIEASLTEIARRAGSRSDIEWTLRQMTLRR
jgi:trans-aconitate 2-methyltransferase